MPWNVTFLCYMLQQTHKYSGPEAFHRASMELIALTATNTAVGRMDRVAAAANEAAGGGYVPGLYVYV